MRPPGMTDNVALLNEDPDLQVEVTQSRMWPGAGLQRQHS